MEKLDTNLIIKSLHQTQEVVEELLAFQDSANCKIHELERRIKKFLKSHPNYTHYENLTASYEFNNKKNKVVKLKFSELEINNEFIDVLSVRIEHEAGSLKLFIENGEKKSPLKSWPSTSGFEEQLPCTVSFRNPDPLINETLTNLGTSDWKTLIAITNLLEQIFSTPAAPIDSLDVDCVEISRFLNSQSEIYAKWPPTMRFDSVSVEKIQHTDNYHFININICNLSISDRLHPRFDFKLSTVDSTVESFGTNPRLEFSEKCQNVLENWHPESINEEGEKLELRFAPPNAMDLNVWNSLSEQDKILITGIIGKLPNILSTLTLSQPQASMRWDDWCALAVDTRHIFIKNMIAQRAILKPGTVAEPI